MTTSELTYPSQFRGHSVKLLQGETADNLGLAGWKITDSSLVLGHGRECFDRAAQRLFSWQAHHYAGVSVRELGENRVELAIGPTRSRCLILEHRTEDDQALMVYGTLPGHVEKGEEAFHIVMEPDGTVRGRCVAFSRHAWIWAKIGAPVARLVQLYITRRYLKGMKPAF